MTLASSQSLSPSGIDPAIGRRVRAGNAAIAALIELAGGHGELLAHEEHSWASLTFQGARHRIMIAFDGSSAVAGGNALRADLGEHEFEIPGWLVADATVVATDQRYGANPRLVVTAELLLVESD